MNLCNIKFWLFVLLGVGLMNSVTADSAIKELKLSYKKAGVDVWFIKQFYEGSDVILKEKSVFTVVYKPKLLSSLVCYTKSFDIKAEPVYSDDDLAKAKIDFSEKYYFSFGVYTGAYEECSEIEFGNDYFSSSGLVLTSHLVNIHFLLKDYFNQNVAESAGFGIKEFDVEYSMLNGTLNYGVLVASEDTFFKFIIGDKEGRFFILDSRRVVVD